MKHDDNIGFIMSNLIFKPLGYSILGLYFMIRHPIKSMLNIIISFIILMAWYGRLKATQGTIINWVDIVIVIIFVSFMARTGKKGSIVG